MRVDTKFDIGQKVFYVRRTGHYAMKPCDICKGVGSLYDKNGTAHTCSVCRGKGRRRGGWEAYWEVRGPSKILWVELHKAKSGDIEVSYEFELELGGDVSNLNDEDCVFAVREEAQEVADTRNAESLACKEKMKSQYDSERLCRMRTKCGYSISGYDEDGYSEDDYCTHPDNDCPIIRAEEQVE